MLFFLPHSPVEAPAATNDMETGPHVFGLMLMASAAAAARDASVSYRFDNFDVPGLSTIPSDFYTRRYPDDS